MSRLFILRHAEAMRAAPGMRDFDRPLTARGHADADEVGGRMARAGLQPGLVLCSPAARTRQTWEGVAPHLGELASAPLFPDGLYKGGASAYIDIVRASGEEDTALMVGHNPTVEEITRTLCRGGENAAMAALASGFPTSGLAVISFAGPLSQIAPGAGRLELFI